MRSPLLAVAAVLLLSGCISSNGSTTTTDASFKDLNVAVSSTTGAIRGIVVDQAIVPIAKVAVTLALPTGGNKTATTDTQGRFTFSELKEGTYFLTLHHLLYKTVQSSVEVKAGVDPPITRIQMEALFSAKPFHEQYKFKGIIACGYNAVLLTAPCVTDYSTIACNGGCAPPAHDALVHAQGDNRAFSTAVGQNWQTIVIELVFQPNGQGTSDRMSTLISYQNRTAGDWYANEEGTSPVMMRLETGVQSPTEQGKPETIKPEGQNDLLILGSIAAAEGQEYGAGVNQEFEIFQTNFYNAKPADGWSFAKGDDFPF